MKIYLRDRNAELVDEWSKVFAGVEEVEVSCGDIFDGPNADAIVSPANSFGKMDGGIDLIYSIFFGWDLEASLMDYLEKNHYGELPVGQAVTIATGNSRYPSLISAPTMRVPSAVPHTVNAYLAFRAALGEAQKYEFRSILCPGLATAVGQMPYKRCAVQMFEAFRNVWCGSIPKSGSEIWRIHHLMTVEQ